MSRFQTLTVFAPAKINLYLHVIGRRDDGYHLLDSLVAFADIGDQVRISPANDFSFTAQGPFASAFTAKEKDASPNSANLAVRAAWMLARAAQREPRVKIALVKNLPLASGLGGGSSDAAAVLWGLTEYWNLSPQAVPAMDGLMLKLGADVPACYACRPAFIRGVGDVAATVPDLPELPVLLVNPGKRCSTARIFSEFDAPFAAPPEESALPPSRDGLLSFLEDRRNMLTGPAVRAVPEIAAALESLEGQRGCVLARMSGSGATCFGIFDDEDAALAAAERILAAHPSWWVRAGTLNRPERY